MKTSMFIRGLAPLAACALLLPTAVSAQTTPYTGTGWVSQVFAPGIFFTNAAGQVLVRASVQTIQVECSDPRMTGRRTAFTDGYFQADGSAVVYGAAYQEVGTWAGTNFTPSGAVWELNWRGVMQTNYSMQASQAGDGSGGTIDSLRMEETLTRGPASNPYDPTVPILYAGTIKPPPVSTTLVSDAFTNGVQGWLPIYACGVVSMYPTNQAFGMRADFSGCSPGLLNNSFHAHPSAGNYNWSLADGQTLECQADLLRISENTTNAAYLVVGGDQGIYTFALGQKGLGVTH